MKMFVTLAAVVFAAGLAYAGSCGSDAKHSHDKAEKAMYEASAKADIVDTAISAGTFSTLVAAVQAADLVDVLKSEGPFTVFAPTDEAFSKLPEGTLESLLKPENKEKLAAILKYHVVAGKVTSDQVVNLSSAKTVEGSEVSIKVEDGSVSVDEAKVVKTDIETANGIIHVIDTVIIPKQG